MSDSAHQSSNPVPVPSERADSGLLKRSLGWRWWLFVGVIAACAGVVVFLISQRKHHAPVEELTLKADAQGVTLSPDAPQWKYIELSVAAASPGLTPLPAPGRVDLDERRTANVGSPLNGRIEKVLVRLGDAVKAGERLFSVRSGAFADLDRELASAEEMVAVKKRLLERSKDLLALQATPEKDFLNAGAELREAELALKAARAKRQSLSIQSTDSNLFWVTAPRGGTIVDLDVFGNQEVGPERDKPLLRISSLDEVLILADVQEVDAADLRKGMAVHILAQGGKASISGAIDHVSQVVDPRRRTVEIRVRAANPNQVLRPNAFVQVALEPDANLQRVRVPAEAVVTEGEKTMVFVAREGGRLESVRVQVGRQRDAEVEILSGLDPGMRFVSRGAILLLNQIDLLE